MSLNHIFISVDFLVSAQLDREEASCTENVLVGYI